MFSARDSYEIFNLRRECLEDILISNIDFQSSYLLRRRLSFFLFLFVCKIESVIQ